MTSICLAKKRSKKSYFDILEGRTFNEIGFRRLNHLHEPVAAELVMDLYAKEKSYEEYRLTGVHRFLLDIPETTEELKMVSAIVIAG